MKRVRAYLRGVGLGLAVAMGWGCEKGEAPKAAPAPPRVEVRHPEVREVVDYDQYNGWMDAVETVEVRARVRGHIDKIGFKDGDMVKKGQVLFELDPRTYEADVARAKEQLKTFQAQLARAQAEEKRIRPMFEQKVAGESELDKAVAERLSFEAQVDSAKQDVARKELDLEYSRVTAPISGRIGRALLTVGNLVNAGGSDPMLATITSVDPIYVYFNVDERALQRYQKARNGGTTGPAGGGLRAMKVPVEFGLETDEGFPRKGVLDFADNRVDQATGTILVRGEAPNPGGLLVPGSRVRVRLPVSKPHEVMLVPDTAILADQDRRYVLVLDEKNVVKRYDVRLGKLLGDGMREIEPVGDEKALGADRWVVTQGLQSARLNYPVEPVKAGEARPASGPATQGAGGEAP